MNIEDLIIGKKYQHIKNGTFAFYAGKNQYGSPVFELENQDGTTVTLPPNYKFIASNTYWAYSGLEKEFSECDPKSDYLFNIGDEFIINIIPDAGEHDYKIGDVIKVIDRSKIPFETNQSSSKAYYKWTNLNNGKSFVSTEDCKLCQTMKPITVEPSTSKTPEYVECIKKDVGIEIGKIYKVKYTRDFEFTSDSGCKTIYTLENTSNSPYYTDYFKPSTKEAYDLQQSGGKIEEFDVDDWVYHRGNKETYQISQILPNNGFKAYSGYACDTGNLSLGLCVKATAEEISTTNSNNLSSLPEKWCIDCSLPGVSEVVRKYANDNNLNPDNWEFNEGRYKYYRRDGYRWNNTNSILKGYTEITLDQFKKWVLKEKPVDNQLSNKETSNIIFKAGDIVVDDAWKTNNTYYKYGKVVENVEKFDGSSPFYIDPIPPFKRSNKEDLEFQSPVIVKTSKNKKSKLVII